ncbi:hypothetical protein ACNTMW_29205 [Planosporangium sp. 12N6]|uniref:hypothetical protein n=1 Tax=Planosporangium spinosum TaxID=3402278 RepID=UPI003CF6D992
MSVPQPDRSWQRMLDEELARQQPPPLAGLIEDSIRQGRRIRRVRTVGRAGATVMAVLVVAVAGWRLSPQVLGPTADRPPTIASASPSAAPSPGNRTPPSPGNRTPGPGSPATSPPTVPSPNGAVDRAPATPAALMALLTGLLPSGTTSHLSGSTQGDISVQLYLDDGRGPGMLRVAVRSGSLSAGQCTPAACRQLPDGGRAVVTRHADNCVQSLLVDVDRGAGSVVEVQVSSCLAWDGTATPAGRMALTEEQAIAVASDPRWGTEMDAALVQAGQRDFPQLATGSGS